MAFTRITSTNIADGAVEPEKVSAAFEADYAKVANLSNYAAIAEIATNIAPKINVVSYANSTYSVLDDTAANTEGGYLVITGTGFQSGAQVLIGTTPATSTTFVSSTELRAQVPAANAASYQLAVVNPDGGTGIKINGITYSGTPTWLTASTLANVQNATAFTGLFEATGATSYSNTTALPSGFNLVNANGYYYGLIELENQTTYNFTIRATDDEEQDSDRAFSLTATVSNVPPEIEYLVVAGGGGGFRGSAPSAPNAGYGGGGGAGGLLHSNTSITAGVTYTVTVGSGGGAETNGGYSSIGTPASPALIYSYGGGKGGWTPSPAGNGGSGGGAGSGAPAAGKGIYPGSTYISATRQGYDGVVGASNPQYNAGGGGGAGGAGKGLGGGPGTTNAFVYYDDPTYGSNGGPGLTDAELNGMLSATSSGALAGAPLNPSYNGITYIAGGGTGGIGGVAYNYAGGFGGGGWGLRSPGTGAAGITNTGGGGAGGNFGTPAVYAGSGGSGLVIIRYPSNYDDAVSTTGSPTLTTSGGYKYYKFTGSGSITW
jgi:hypothetical protein